MKKLLIGIALMGLLMQTAKADTTPNPKPSVDCEQMQNVHETVCQDELKRIIADSEKNWYLGYMWDEFKIGKLRGYPCHTSTLESSKDVIDIWYYGCENGSTIGPEHYTFRNSHLKEHVQL